MKLQLIIATLLCLSGITLLFLGFWIPPQGEIDPSVLVAFGEISTFAGALFGVDYKYKKKMDQRKNMRGKFDKIVSLRTTNYYQLWKPTVIVSFFRKGHWIIS